MIARYNERITITLPKSLIKKIRRLAKSTNTPLSKQFKELLVESLRIYEDKPLTPEEMELLEEQIRIAKIRWLDD